MKRLVLTTLLAFFYALPSRAQVWVENNAVWHYDFWETSTGMQGFIKVKHTGDTLIDGHNSKRFDALMYGFFMDGPPPDGELVMSTWPFGTWFTYVSGDTVFFKRQPPTGMPDVPFRVLYNFNAQVGDQWMVQTVTDTPSFDQFGCNDSSYLEVQSRSTVTLAGESMTQLNVNGVEGNYYSIDGPVVSRFGYVNQQLSANFLFPYVRSCDNTIIEYYYTKFKCFQDDGISYNPSGEDCEYLLNHLGTNELQLSLGVAPNPASSELTVQMNGTMNRCEVIGITGEALMNIAIPEQDHCTISVATLAPGVYYLKAYDHKGRTALIRFIRN